MSEPPVLYRVFGFDGEYDRQAMKTLIRRGEVTSLSEVAISGTDEWKSAGMYPELQRYLALTERPVAAASSGTTNTKQMLVAAVLIAAGLFFGVPSAVDFFRGVASLGWPAANEAHFLQGEVVRRSSSSFRRARRRSPRYQLHVTYRYVVDGSSYLGDTVSFGREWFTSPRSQLMEARRGPFRVWYKPGLPHIAVMRRGPTAGAAFGALAGAAGMIIGVLMLLKPKLAAELTGRVKRLRS